MTEGARPLSTAVTREQLALPLFSSPLMLRPDKDGRSCRDIERCEQDQLICARRSGEDGNAHRTPICCPVLGTIGDLRSVARRGRCPG